MHAASAFHNCTTTSVCSMHLLWYKGALAKRRQTAINHHYIVCQNCCIRDLAGDDFGLPAKNEALACKLNKMLQSARALTAICVASCWKDVKSQHTHHTAGCCSLDQNYVCALLLLLET